MFGTSFTVFGIFWEDIDKLLAILGFFGGGLLVTWADLSVLGSGKVAVVCFCTLSLDS